MNDKVRTSRRWTHDDEEKLTRLYIKERWVIKHIAYEMGRTQDAVENRIQKLELQRPYLRRALALNVTHEEHRKFIKEARKRGFNLSTLMRNIINSWLEGKIYGSKE